MAFRPLVDQLGQFLAALDLSFLVSGAVGALGVWLIATGLGIATVPETADAWTVLAATVAAYVVGLVAQPIGHQLRRSLRGWPPDGLLIARLDEYGVNWRELLGVSEGELDADRLYTLLWTELRERDAMRETYQFLQGYWVRTAIYDGLPPAIALLGLGAFLRVWNADLGWLAWSASVGAAAAVIAGAVWGVSQVCFNQARKLQELSITEVAAATAHLARHEREP
jgi:hypothetical protein